MASEKITLWLLQTIRIPYIKKERLEKEIIEYIF